MGALANTRGSVLILWDLVTIIRQYTRRLGDLQYKKFGVTPEPEVRTKLLESPFSALFFVGTTLMPPEQTRIGLTSSSSQMEFHPLFPMMR